MRIFRSRRLAGVGGVAVAFFGRGPIPRPEPAILAGSLRAPTGTLLRTATARQIHSNTCLAVTLEDDPGDGPVGTGDALVTSDRGIALGVATADCLPVVVVDPLAPAVAVVHAGWRGTHAGVLSAALQKLMTRYNARPERMILAIGPGARACCYEVGPDVIGAFSEPTGAAPGEKPPIIRGRRGFHLDLVEANRRQALSAGVPIGAIDDLGICSICRVDDCHSHRRDGDAAGRMWLLAALI